MAIEVLKADSPELQQAIYRLRYHIYVDELKWTPPNTDHANRLIRDELDELADNYLLHIDGQAAGSLRLLSLGKVPDLEPFHKKYALGQVFEHFSPQQIILSGRFMLHPKVRHGKAILGLMGRGFEDARRAGARLNFADCSPHMLPLYEHLGFRKYADPFNDPDFGYKIPILMLMGDQQSMGRYRSPLARVAEQFPQDTEAVDWFTAHFGHDYQPGSAALLPEGMFLDVLAERVGEDPVHHLSLLKDLSHEESERFLAQATVVSARPGDRIIRQGEHDATLYVMLNGIADVYLDEAPDSPINLVSTGDTFGEIGLIGKVPRTANVVARSDCEVLVLSADFFQRFLVKDPVISAKVTLNLAHSLAVRLALATPGQIHIENGRYSEAEAVTPIAYQP